MIKFDKHKVFLNIIAGTTNKTQFSFSFSVVYNNFKTLVSLNKLCILIQELWIAVLLNTVKCL